MVNVHGGIAQLHRQSQAHDSLNAITSIPLINFNHAQSHSPLPLHSPLMTYLTQGVSPSLKITLARKSKVCQPPEPMIDNAKHQKNALIQLNPAERVPDRSKIARRHDTSSKTIQRGEPHCDGSPLQLRQKQVYCSSRRHGKSSGALVCFALCESLQLSIPLSFYPVDQALGPLQLMVLGYPSCPSAQAGSPAAGTGSLPARPARPATRLVEAASGRPMSSSTIRRTSVALVPALWVSQVSAREE